VHKKTVFAYILDFLFYAAFSGQAWGSAAALPSACGGADLALALGMESNTLMQ
jgi:hypothetical protein